MNHQLNLFMAKWFVYKRLKFYTYIVKMIHKEMMYQHLLLIKSLGLNKDVEHIIKMEYKYSLKEKSFKQNHRNVMTHLKYYIFINLKVNKKHKRRDTLLKTIKFFDT